jgi:hypothetical protein
MLGPCSPLLCCSSRPWPAPWSTVLDTLSTLSLPYLLALLCLSAQWLYTVRQQSRAWLRPHLSLLAAPGLAALILAPLVQTEALFGFGAALLIIAAYAPAAYVLAPARHAQRARTVGSGLVLTLVLLGGALLAYRLSAPAAATLWPLWSCLLLAALAYMLGAGLPRVQAETPGFALRFRPSHVPSWPDLELRFDGEQARVQNIGAAPLVLAGWSPSGQNGWRRPLDAQGKPLVLLARGATATLAPWPEGQNGVRLWYVRQNAPAEALVFRADWTQPDSPRRVLN